MLDAALPGRIVAAVMGLAVPILAAALLIWLLPQQRLLIGNLLFLVVCTGTIYLHVRQPDPDAGRDMR